MNKEKENDTNKKQYTIMKKIAILSNINMNYVIRMLQQKSIDVYQSEGYGNELGTMLNNESSYHDFGADITFLMIDLMELINHDMVNAERIIEQWFQSLGNAIDHSCIYYISNSYLFGTELYISSNRAVKDRLEYIWDSKLLQLADKFPNVRIFPYKMLIEELGENRAFSKKMWYMGKILFSNEMHVKISDKILHCIELEYRVPQKVLVVDLDNTLWGGLVGENDHKAIELSDDKAGLAYKNGQRILKEMKNQGVILAIVSKNNEPDAMKIIEEHPHMVLKKEDFASYKINWKQKTDNILDISRELNLGLDSFVFWDDNPAERELVKKLIPQVIVPDFPDKPEEIEYALIHVFREYFEKNVVTSEDKDKTNQYIANAKRTEFKNSAVSFEQYLKELNIKIIRENPVDYVERITQLINKTNQFNLTTIRMQQADVVKLLSSNVYQVFLYRISDCFGDNGITAVVIIRMEGAVPVIEQFIMSCRIMGKLIENAILEDVENDMLKQGCSKVTAIYTPTEKNKPVEKFYEGLGYYIVESREDGTVEYEISLNDRPARQWYGEKINL